MVCHRTSWPLPAVCTVETRRLTGRFKGLSDLIRSLPDILRARLSTKLFRVRHLLGGLRSRLSTYRTGTSYWALVRRRLCSCTIMHWSFAIDFRHDDGQLVDQIFSGVSLPRNLRWIGLWNALHPYPFSGHCIICQTSSKSCCYGHSDQWNSNG